MASALIKLLFSIMKKLFVEFNYGHSYTCNNEQFRSPKSVTVEENIEKIPNTMLNA